MREAVFNVWVVDGVNAIDMMSRVYAEYRLKILARDFGFVISDEEREHVLSLTDKNDIDRAIRTIINRRFDD